MYGSGAVFRGAQHELAKFMISSEEKHQVLLAILATGSGKSLAFLGFHYLGTEPGGITIVIVGMKALIPSHIQACETRRILYHEWNGKIRNTPLETTSSRHLILFISPEAMVASYGAFQSFLEEKSNESQIRAIIFDECHLILRSTSNNHGRTAYKSSKNTAVNKIEPTNFRSSFFKIHELLSRVIKNSGRKKPKIIHITGTLPPSWEREWAERMKLIVPNPAIEYNAYKRIRDITVRNDIHLLSVAYDTRIWQDPDYHRSRSAQKRWNCNDGRSAIMLETLDRFCPKSSGTRRVTMVFVETTDEAELFHYMVSRSNQQEKFDKTQIRPSLPLHGKLSNNLKEIKGTSLSRNDTVAHIITGSVNTVFATSAGENGIDSPYVDIVIHFVPPTKFINMDIVSISQQMGRIRPKSGRIGQSILLYPSTGKFTGSKSTIHLSLLSYIHLLTFLIMNSILAIRESKLSMFSITTGVSLILSDCRDCTVCDSEKLQKAVSFEHYG